MVLVIGPQGRMPGLPVLDVRFLRGHHVCMLLGCVADLHKDGLVDLFRRGLRRRMAQNIRHLGEFFRLHRQAVGANERAQRSHRPQHLFVCELSHSARILASGTRLLRLGPSARTSPQTDGEPDDHRRRNTALLIAHRSSQA